MSATGQLNTALAGRYTIEREIGRGGMATVYLARDLRHARAVALKVVDADLGAVLGAERFLSEIRVTANLQHPNLLPLFDSGEADGLLYYTMPFVRGESLRARLDRERQLPVDEAVHISAAVAGALDYAHGEGVIHRDLKPENILLAGGEPLVADFGIALAVSRAGGARITQTGLSLGTPQYMSPEQATADRVIDGRSDIYSLGAVTYEMLTGEPPHMGTTAQAVIARVLTEPAPHVTSTRPSVPAYVDHAVARALEKLPADRWPTARALGDALQGRSATPTSRVDAATAMRVAPGSRATLSDRLRDRVVGALLAVVVLMSALAAWGWREWMTAPREVPVRLSLAIPTGLRLQRVTGPPVVISPDGRAVVFVAAAANARPQLYYRSLASLDVHPLAGTEWVASSPFFSPDGAWVGFFARGSLKKVAVDGGEAVALAQVPGGAGGAWGANDVIVGGSNDGLWRAPATGGAPTLLTHVDTTRGELLHAMPHFLPDGKSVVFDIDRTGGIDRSEVGIVDVNTGRYARLGVDARNPLGYAAGMLVVGRPDLGLTGVPFDAREWRVTGPPVALLQDVSFKFNGGVEASLADDGSLVYLHGTGHRLVLVDEQGATMTEVDRPREYYSVHFAPDGRRLAMAVGGGGASTGSTTGFDVWIYDVASGTLSRLTSRGSAGFATWTPDGRRVAYAVAPGGAFTSATELWWARADGSGDDERIALAPRGKGFNWPPTFTPEARHAIVNVSVRGGTQEIWDVLLDGPVPARQWTPLVRSSFNNVGPSLSPDGRWLAYASNETGMYEVYVRPYPGPGGRVQVSTGGGWAPLWDHAGRLYYRQSANGGALIVASISAPGSAGADPAVADRHEVLPGNSAATETVGPRSYDVRPDGKAFALIQPSAAGGDEIVVALGWRDEVVERARAASRR